MYLLGNLPFFNIHVNCIMTGDDSLCVSAISNACVGERPGATLSVLRCSFTGLANC